MKKAIVMTVLYSLIAAAICFVGILLLAALTEQGEVANTASWNKTLAMPRNAALVTVVVLILLDLACLALAVFTAVSAFKLRKLEKQVKKQADKPRFSRLIWLDQHRNDRELFPERDADAVGTRDTVKIADVAALTEGFRNFAASRCGLYYEPNVIRTYIAGMAASRLTILQGISGTGKTSLPYAFGKYVNNPAVITPVQPSWKDRTDLLGYYNEFTDTYTETELLYKLYEANLTDRVYTMTLDELNIARVEYYFAEFLSLLELPDAAARRLRVTSDSCPSDPALFSAGTLTLPDNVWFVGTANNDDSTLTLSDKVYDRACVIDLNRRSAPFAAPFTPAADLTGTELRQLFADAVAAAPLSQDLKLKFEEFDRYLSARLGITFGNRTLKQLERFVPVFVAAGGTENGAADAVICHKILRKLEGLNPAVCRREAGGLIRQLNYVFGEGALPDCAAYLRGFAGGED